MSTVFLVAGLAITVIGVVFVALGKFEKQPTPAAGEESLGDISKIIEQFNKMLELVEQRYRIGIVLMGFGLALVGVGVFLETQDAKDAAEAAAGGVLFLRRP